MILDATYLRIAVELPRNLKISRPLGEGSRSRASPLGMTPAQKMSA
jgi:hypothetical protein